MKKSITFFFVIALFAYGNYAWGEKYTFPEETALFSIEIPDDWMVEISEGVFYGKSADSLISLSMWALEKNVIIDENLVAVLKKQLAKTFKDFETEEPYEIEINGMNVMFVEGMGVYAVDDENSTDVRVSSAMFSPDNQTVFILLYFGTPEAEEKHALSLEEMITSLQAE